MAQRDATAGETVGTVTVLPPCDVESGNWACLTCVATFPNNLTANSHADRPGEHVMAWACHEHGPEAPK